METAPARPHSRSGSLVVFVLSPKAAASEMCRFEVEIAWKIAKRIIPIVCAPLEGTEPPDHLSSLNYIYFYQEKAVSGSGFGSGLAKLAATLRTDIDWMREHTRIGGLASRWNEREKDTALLLRGNELRDAEGWLKRQPRDGPDAGELTRAFLAASRRAEDEGSKKKLQDAEMIARATTLERAVQHFISMGLRRKLNVLLLAVGTLGAVLFATISGPYLNKLAKEEVEQNTRIMSASATGMRKYTSQEIAPLLMEQLQTRFQRQAVSAYAAQKLFAVLGAQFPPTTPTARSR